MILKLTSYTHKEKALSKQTSKIKILMKNKIFYIRDRTTVCNIARIDKKIIMIP